MAATRPKWDDYFMAIARIVATRATCDRLHVGAVLVKNNRIVSTGYNGAPSGMPQCDGPEGHLMEDGHCIRTLHAEENALLQAAFIGGTSSQGTTLYTTASPCYHCAKKIITAGITRVVCALPYTNTTAPVSEALQQGNVEVLWYVTNPEWDTQAAQLFSAPIGPTTR